MLESGDDAAFQDFLKKGAEWLEMKRNWHYTKVRDTRAREYGRARAHARAHKHVYMHACTCADDAGGSLARTRAHTCVHTHTHTRVHTLPPHSLSRSSRRRLSAAATASPPTRW